MARIVGVDIPNNKRVEVSLTYIFGIGNSIANKIMKEANIPYVKRVKDLSAEELNNIRSIIEKKYKVEGELRSEINFAKKRLVDIGCYRGLRHRRGLPVRGQRTKTNAKTRKRRVGRIR